MSNQALLAPWELIGNSRTPENQSGEHFMKCNMRSTILFTAALLLGGMTVSSFAADGDFNKDHPRRAEVNKRLNNQDKRIRKEVKEGDMTKAQAANRSANKVVIFSKRHPGVSLTDHQEPPIYGGSRTSGMPSQVWE
jgi:hypothetical protein